MVDLDFKRGPDNSAEILRPLLINAGFHRNNTPLVTIFCRTKLDYDKLKSLRDICRLRPLYQDKGHISEMKAEDVRIMGIRNYQYKSNIVLNMRNVGIHAFVNSMRTKKDLEKIPIIGGIIAQIVTWREQSIQKIYKKASEAGALFIQTDDLPGLVTFLTEKGLYEGRVLNRHFQPLEPEHGDDLNMV